METKNILFTLLLSFLILTGWHYLYEVPRIEKFKATQTQNNKISSIPESGSLQEKNNVQNVNSTLAHVEEAHSSVKKIEIISNQLRGSLTLKGLRFDDISLVNYHRTYEKKQSRRRVISTHF